MSFWIATDACCDLPSSFSKAQNQFVVVPMSYQLDSEVSEIDPYENDLDAKMHLFYQKLLNGSVSTTFQVNQHKWEEYLNPLCDTGHDILILVFSSALSGTYASAIAAAEELRRNYPDRTIRVVDTLSASLGQGMFVHHMLGLRDSGKDIEECYQYALDNAQRMIHWFTIDDLHFLRRGGRVSGASAYIGSILKIKPVMNVNPEGKLVPREKVQGRKRSLHSLYEKAKKYAFEPEKQTFFISHGDCAEDAAWLADKLKTELGVPEVIISMIGPIIGSHSGPNTVALFFMGEDGAGRLTSVEN